MINIGDWEKGIAKRKKRQEAHMENRGTEDHKLWLFDLAHGNISPE